MEPTRVVLTDDQLIAHAARHIVSMAQHLFADLPPGCSLLELSFPGMTPVSNREPAPSPRVRVFAFSDDVQMYVFGVLPDTAAGRLTADGAAQLILECLRSTQSGDRGHWSYQVVTPRPHQRENTAAAEQQLTDREVDVLQHLATGKSDRAIGSSLGIAHSTVRYHLARIYAKLGVQSRHEALVWAIRAGWGDESRFAP